MKTRTNVSWSMIPMLLWLTKMNQKEWNVTSIRWYSEFVCSSLCLLIFLEWFISIFFLRINGISQFKLLLSLSNFLNLIINSYSLNLSLQDLIVPLPIEISSIILSICISKKFSLLNTYSLVSKAWNKIFDETSQFWSILFLQYVISGELLD
jgi:hypothetical protein